MNMKIPELPFLFFPLFWFALCHFISFLSGWRELVQYYPSQGQTVIQKKFLQSAGMRWKSRYSNCLTVGANSEGLYLAILIFFRPGHPPLFIPWNDIKLRHRRFLGCSMLELKISRAPSAELMLWQKMEDFFRTASGRVLFIEAADEAGSTVPWASGLQLLGIAVGVMGLLTALFVSYFNPHR